MLYVSGRYHAALLTTSTDRRRLLFDMRGAPPYPLSPDDVTDTSTRAKSLKCSGSIEAIGQEAEPLTPPTVSTNHSPFRLKRDAVIILFFLFTPLTTAMAAAARFLVRGAVSKASIANVNVGAQSSFGITLLRLSPSFSSKTKTQRRNAAHFTYHPDPVPTEYGK